MNMSIIKNYFRKHDLPALHCVGKINFRKRISEKFRIFSAPKVQKFNPVLSKGMCVFKKQYNLISCWYITCPELDQEVKEHGKQQTEVPLLFRFLIIVSTKRKPKCKTLFNHGSHCFCINFFKCWIFNKVLTKKEFADSIN